MDANGQSRSDDARRAASKHQREGKDQASMLGTGRPGLADAPPPPFQRAHLDAWLKLMRRDDFDILAGAVHTEQIRRGSGSICAAANNSRQQTAAHVRLSNFPPEILSLIFSRVDTATLLGAVPHVCRDWRAACSDDLYGPKVRLKLHSVRQVLRIRPECLELWVAAAVARFASVINLDLSRCSIENGMLLKCAGSLQRITKLNMFRCDKITDAGLEHFAQLTQLTSLNLYDCDNITDAGRALVPCLSPKLKKKTEQRKKPPPLKRTNTDAGEQSDACDMFDC